MKGIALMTIAYAIIAIVAVSLFIGLFSASSPEFTTGIYCSLYQVTNAIIFLTTKPPLPPECTFQPVMERKTIEAAALTDLNNRLTDFIIGCWEKSQMGTAGETFICYELYFKGVDGNINERNVTDSLILKNYCNILPNNFLDLENTSYSCGDENKITWESNITTGVFIIKYDVLKRNIVVK